MLSEGEIWARGSSNARIEEFLRYNNPYRIEMERNMPERYADYLHFARKILRERAERDGKKAMQLAHLNGEQECIDLSYSYGEDSYAQLNAQAPRPRT